MLFITENWKLFCKHRTYKLFNFGSRIRCETGICVILPLPEYYWYSNISQSLFNKARNADYLDPLKWHNSLYIARPLYCNTLVSIMVPNKFPFLKISFQMKLYFKKNVRPELSYKMVLNDNQFIGGVLLICRFRAC